MFCRKCGAKLPDDAQFCTDCGMEVIKKKTEEEASLLDAPKNTVKEKLNPQSLKENAIVNLLKENKIIVAVVILIAIVVGVVFALKGSMCKDPGCNEKAKYGDYCGYHVCMYPGCKSHRESGESYCWYHLEITTPKAEDDLIFSNIRLDNGYSYTTMDAKLTNYGETTYTFVQVKGVFKDYYGSVVDTDWTYAVGSEGIAPGEAVSIHLSVNKNYSIDDCELSIMDFDYE